MLATHDASQLAELEAAYWEEPYGAAGGDEALGVTLAAIYHTGPYPPKEPVKAEEVCPRLKVARRVAPAEKTQSPEEQNQALLALAAAWGAK